MLEKIFHLKENHTDVKTELMAGVTTFMTMAYILAAVLFHRKERILQEKISVGPGGLHLMLCDPLTHLLGDGLDRAILKGNLQPGGLHQLRVAGQTGTAHQLEVALPGILVVLEAQHGGAFL